MKSTDVTQRITDVTQRSEPRWDSLDHRKSRIEVQCRVPTAHSILRVVFVTVPSHRKTIRETLEKRDNVTQMSRRPS